MGRGSSKVGTAQIKKIRNELTAAKRTETRLRAEYQSKSGAVIGYDWNSGGIPEYESRVAERNKAEAKYQKAVNKRERLQNRLNKATAARSRATRSEDVPLF